MRKAYTTLIQSAYLDLEKRIWSEVAEFGRECRYFFITLQGVFLFDGREAYVSSSCVRVCHGQLFHFLFY